ncbi:MAG: hypothetical protein IT452_14040 [Planctomycetia bacterium]|nr:hypothetical protein [Planctomycetia bacterium]
MKRLAVLAGVVLAAGCAGDPPPRSKDAEAAFDAYRSSCAAAQQVCERAADSSGMEKGTRGLGAFLEQWGANPDLKPPADAAERGTALRERFIELDALLRSSRAVADGTGEDEATVQALDDAQSAVRSLVAAIRDLASPFEKDIVAFASRDRQSDLAQRMLASSQDLRETTLPTCENAARSLASARDALKRALAVK